MQAINYCKKNPYFTFHFRRPKKSDEVIYTNKAGEVIHREALAHPICVFHRNHISRLKTQSVATFPTELIFSLRKKKAHGDRMRRDQMFADFRALGILQPSQKQIAEF